MVFGLIMSFGNSEAVHDYMAQLNSPNDLDECGTGFFTKINPRELRNFKYQEDQTRAFALQLRWSSMILENNSNKCANFGGTDIASPMFVSKGVADGLLGRLLLKDAKTSQYLAGVALDFMPEQTRSTGKLLSSIAEPDKGTKLAGYIQTLCEDKKLIIPKTIPKLPAGIGGASGAQNYLGVLYHVLNEVAGCGKTRPESASDIDRDNYNQKMEDAKVNDGATFSFCGKSFGDLLGATVESLATGNPLSFDVKGKFVLESHKKYPECNWEEQPPFFLFDEPAGDIVFGLEAIRTNLSQPSAVIKTLAGNVLALFPERTKKFADFLKARYDQETDEAKRPVNKTKFCSIPRNEATRPSLSKIFPEKTQTRLPHWLGVYARREYPNSPQTGQNNLLPVYLYLNHLAKGECVTALDPVVPNDVKHIVEHPVAETEHKKVDPKTETQTVAGPPEEDFVEDAYRVRSIRNLEISFLEKLDSVHNRLENAGATATGTLAKLTLFDAYAQLLSRVVQHLATVTADETAVQQRVRATLVAVRTQLVVPIAAK